MRNLIAFLRRFRVFLVFAALQIVALSLYFTFFAFPRSQYFTTASNVTGTIYSWRNDLTKQFSLSKTNDKLQKRNKELMEQVPKNFVKINRHLYSIDDTLYKQKYKYLIGEVILSTVDKTNNYFTIDIGSRQGVKEGDGVISDNGVVGVIHNCSPHFSVIKSVLTSDINIDIVVKPINLNGLLKWDHKSPRYGNLTGISNDLKIKKWSKVYTRGSSGIYPQGLLIGRVASLEPIEGEAFWDVKILFSEDYRTLQRVYVVKNLMFEEQKKLEAKNPKDTPQ